MKSSAVTALIRPAQAMETPPNPANAKTGVDSTAHFLTNDWASSFDIFIFYGLWRYLGTSEAQRVARKLELAVGPFAFD